MRHVVASWWAAFVPRLAFPIGISRMGRGLVSFFWGASLVWPLKRRGGLIV